ncbi:MAG: 30S ribosomal protein S1 [Bryobacteraceae bacterium]
MANRPPTPDDELVSSKHNDVSFGDILSEYESQHGGPASRTRETVAGTVIKVSPDQVFIDIGLKTEGVIAVADFHPDPPKQGETLHVSIAGRSPEGYYQLSRVKVARPKDWSSLEHAFAEKKAIAGVVSAVVKGGLTVDVGVRAFLPASRSGAKDAAEIEKLVGQEITCRIIKLDIADEDVVVDRRAVLEEEERQAREKVVSDLKPGAVIRGTVRSLTDYGAFVDIGGVDGLLHVADMSWGRVGKPADLLSLGDSIEVQLLKVDTAKRKISLGMKQLMPDPWTLAAEKYTAGDRVPGIVTRLTEFGAFVELEPGVEGLIHLSEMSWNRKVRKPTDVLSSGDSVEVVVLGVSPQDKRISLGLKQALGDPWADAGKRFPAGTIVEGPITSLAKFGAFVTLSDGIEGMIHVGDIAADKRINHPQEVLKVGQAVRAQVLEFDREKRRIRLGIKQLQPASIDEYIAEHKEGDVVTGRVAGVASGVAKVELGEGVHASCAVTEDQVGAAAASGFWSEKPDISSLGSMLSAKWKQGAAGAGPRKVEATRAGQIRSFRIVRLDPQQKRIELEIAG